ncbi:hypothetical protein OAR89_04615, partial [Pelagibacteraceae bacterium]|nr:hypothetical protein [Pelagibacteraceae bacterium]
MKRPPSHKIAPGFVENFENIRVINGFNKDISITKSKLKSRVAAVILSRLKSKRLPGKALKIINDESLMTHLIKRVKLTKNVNKIIMATTRNKEDKKICEIAKKNKISFYRGDEKNVLRRMYEATKKLKCDISIRITGDDILIDPFYLDKLIKFHLENNLEYSNNKNLPGGTEVEIFNTNILKFLLDTIDDLNGTEYLTFFIQRYKDQFITGSLNIPKKHQSKKSLTIDTITDFLFVKKFLKSMSKNKKKYDYTMDDIINYLQKNNKKKPISKKPILINTDLKWEKIII